ncbi:hypothetical protein HGG82_15545 [Marinomonas sp. M1K-6]|uniref:Uncharacterized protein n=1 Tax=Marinomonas profundi TaxID=2726122 RepID=A0A847RFH6_9GAMM|nr:hypothetical protein [Marinomonas profundi]NLQ19020.1 hypothetical protein [Marinomonas profundi]UDV02067.1 hypothetical protein J8N69_10695 [Marinomonas profundi]
MKDNLIPFPTRDPVKLPTHNASDELNMLRAAFDRARAEWPLEIAELPENNKIYSGAKK